MSSSIDAHIEGPVEVGTIVDVRGGTRIVESIQFAESQYGRHRIRMEDIITEEPARAVYPVICPVCKKVFVYGVEQHRFLSTKDMDRKPDEKKFFLMPAPCAKCRSDDT